MYRMRLVLGALVVALVVGVSGALTSSSGQLPQEPASGVTYGGEKAFDTVWLRLHPSRSVIAAVEIPWEIAPDRCKNDRNGYYSTLFAGFHYDFPIDVSPEGKFRKTVVDRYRDQGVRYEERQTVTGTITAERASGTIRAVGITTKPNGRVGRCTSRVQTWSAVN